MATDITNMIRYCSAIKLVDYANDNIKAILMDTGYTFDPDTDESYSDVSGSELATGNGYTRNTKVLTTVTVTKNNTTNRAEVTCDDVTWTATTGNIGPTPGMILFDDSVTSSGSAPTDPVIGYIDFGSELTQAAGGTLTIQNIQIDL